MKGKILLLVPGATLFIFTRHGGDSGNLLVTFHLSVIRLSTDAVFKKGVDPLAV